MSGSILNRIEQELRQLEESKLSVTMGLRFTRGELEQLEALAQQHSTTKADIIRTALKVVYSLPVGALEQASDQPEDKDNNEIDLNDF